MAEYVVIDKEQLESDLTVVADSIRAKGGTSEPLEFPHGMKDAIEGIESGGSGNDEFWYKTSASWTDNFKSLFSNANSKTLPLLDFSNANNMRNMVYENNTLESVDYYINSAKATDMYQMFFKCANLKRLVGLNCSSVKNFYEVFKNCSSLETIEEPFDLSAVTSTISGAFFGCPLLKDILFIDGTIPYDINIAHSSLLTDKSIQSIINGLKDLAGGTSRKITFHTDVVMKLTEEQTTTIFNKNWNIG